MFCPSCGAEYGIELNYCNRCGANLSSALDSTPQVAPVDLTKAIAAIATAMAVITIVGFGAVIFGAIQLARATTIGTDPIMAMILMGVVTILTTDFLLVRQLSRLITAWLPSKNTPQLKRPQAPVFSPNASMPEFPRPITARLAPGASVTENTTRFLDETARRETSE